MTNFIEQSVGGVANLSPYQPGKPLEELEREYGISNAVKVASNENPFGPSPKVIETIQNFLANPVELGRYPDGSGFSLKAKISQFYGLKSEQLTLGNGSNDVLDIISRCFSGPGDEVIFSAYAFAIYYLTTQAVGAKPVITPAQDWGHDLEAMLAAITDNTKLIFIANPNNPTGTCLEGSDIKNFLDKVPEHVVVVIDEAYMEFASHALSPWSKKYQQALQWLDNYPNLIVTRTFSKAYGLASFRVGFGASSAEIADILNRVRQPFNNSILALETALVALDDQAFIEKVVQNNWQGMELLIKGFEEQGLAYIPSAGNFICVEVGDNADEVYDKLLYQGVITRPIGAYKMPRHLRVSVGSPEENQRVLEALKVVLG